MVWAWMMWRIRNREGSRRCSDIRHPAGGWTSPHGAVYVMTLCTKRTEYQYGPSSSTPIKNMVSDGGLLMVRHNWTREEDLAVLYAKLTHGNAFRLHPDLLNLSVAMGRSTSSLLMRKANFDSLDPSVPSSGLSNAAKLTREVWDEYQKRPVQIATEAHRVYLKLLSTRTSPGT